MVYQALKYFTAYWRPGADVTTYFEKTNTNNM